MFYDSVIRRSRWGERWVVVFSQGGGRRGHLNSLLPLEILCDANIYLVRRFILRFFLFI